MIEQPRRQPQSRIPRSGKYGKVSPSVLGWAVSILFHIGIAALFLSRPLFSTPDEPDRQAAAVALARQLPFLQPDPVIADLKMEPLPTDSINFEMPELITPPAESLLPKPAYDTIAVYDPGSAGNARAPTDTTSGLYQSSFCGVAAKAQGICYVVDCSGSMIVGFDYVRRQLQRAVEALSPAQYFHIIFYAAGEPFEGPALQLVRAGAPNRQEALNFVRRMKLVTVSDPETAGRAAAAALKRAFEVAAADGRPADLIYLLTDGQFDHQLVRQEVQRRQQERKRPAQINVIACGNRQNETYLRSLATDYQGQYRFVSDVELAQVRK